MAPMLSSDFYSPNGFAIFWRAEIHLRANANLLLSLSWRDRVVSTMETAGYVVLPGVHKSSLATVFVSPLRSVLFSFLPSTMAIS